MFALLLALLAIMAVYVGVPVALMVAGNRRDDRQVSL
jgi:L-alanine-DL-glutamate epimerase-like enolase superfamily enzyme